MTDHGEIAVAAGPVRPARVRARLGAILGAHTLVDVYAAFVAPLLGILEVRCGLRPAETAMLLGTVSVASGVSQPVSAWFGDRLDSRLFGPAGLALAAVCLSCLGAARDFWTLMAIVAVGQVGVGMFHPAGASSAGHLADQLPGAKRSLGLGFFFVAGMAGGIIGAQLAPTLARRPDGFDLLRTAMVPGLLAAVVLQVAIGRIPHRHAPAGAPDATAPGNGRRWRAVGVLYAANAMRFTVNMALFYLFVRWAQAPIAAANPGWSARQVADAAAPINGNLVAMVILGMAVGGLASGALVRAGRERTPMVLVPVLFAPAVALFPLAGVAGGYVLALLAGIGFAAMIPVTLALGQRMLPRRTSLASGLVLGGALALAIAGPAGAELMLGPLGWGLGAAFGVTAALLALSGIVCLALDDELLRGHGERPDGAAAR